MSKRRKFDRPSDQRQAMIRNMVTSLLKEEEIKTTVTRAKDTKRVAEKMITLAKRGDLHARRLASRVIYEPAVVQKLFNEIGPKYADRNGGYTRILKLGPRIGDGAEIAILKLV